MRRGGERKWDRVVERERGTNLFSLYSSLARSPLVCDSQRTNGGVRVHSKRGRGCTEERHTDFSGGFSNLTGEFRSSDDSVVIPKTGASLQGSLKTQGPPYLRLKLYHIPA